MRATRGSTKKSSHDEEAPRGQKRSRKDFEELPQRRELQDLEHYQKEERKFECDDIDDDQHDTNYIRLLILEPILREAKTLSARAQHKTPQALSYTWGNERADCSVLIKTSTPGQRSTTLRSIAIRKNLDDCLRRLRIDAEGAPRVLWIDVLCTNQSQDGTQEKNAQVQKMAAIYERATRVCIWVGAHENDSGKVIPFIHRILSLDDLDDLLRDRDRTAKCAAFSAFLQRPFFSRRWVIQEIAMSGSKRVYCGDDWIEWNDLIDAINLFEKHNLMVAKLEKDSVRSKRGQPIDGILKEIKAFSADTLVNITSSLSRRRKMPGSNGKDDFYIECLASLERLVSTLQHFDCGDSRDIIYAVALGRDTWANPPLQPDYSGTAVTKVYEDFVEFEIKTSKSLDIICVSWAMDREEKVVEDKWVSLRDHPDVYFLAKVTLYQAGFLPINDEHFARKKVRRTSGQTQIA